MCKTTSLPCGQLLLDEDIEFAGAWHWDWQRLGTWRAAVIALSGLLENVPEARAWEIEEQLERFAGGQVPSEMAAEPIDWKNVASAWRQWWQSDGAKIVMAEPSVAASSKTLRGYTLLVQQQNNAITELGPDGKPRWTLTGLQGPTDAQVLANQHVLIAEQGRVTERDLNGNVLWKVERIQPISVQRLANGNTFIPCSGLILEVDRAGKEVLRLPIGGMFVAAHRLPDGRILAFDRQSIIQFRQIWAADQASLRSSIGGGGLSQRDHG